MFSPSARTLQPDESNFDIKYSIKTSEVVTKNIFNEVYLINVSALRTHSLVSEYALKDVCSLVNELVQ